MRTSKSPHTNSQQLRHSLPLSQHRTIACMWRARCVVTRNGMHRLLSLETNTYNTETLQQKQHTQQLENTSWKLRGHMKMTTFSVRIASLLYYSCSDAPNQQAPNPRPADSRRVECMFSQNNTPTHYILYILYLAHDCVCINNIQIHTCTYRRGAQARLWLFGSIKRVSTYKNKVAMLAHAEIH